MYINKRQKGRAIVAADIANLRQKWASTMSSLLVTAWSASRTGDQSQPDDHRQRGESAWQPALVL